MHPAADPSSDRTGRSHHIRFWKIVWRSGGPWGRLFVAWFWIGLGLAVTIAIGARLWLDSPPGEWRRYALVGAAVIATWLPTGWALESVSTLRKLMETGLEHAELTRMKISYLECYGRQGGNPVARRWALTYLIVYLLWLVVGIWVLPALGVRDLLVLSLLDAVIVFGTMIIVTLRVRQESLVQTALGFPIAELAIRLKREGVRR